MSKWPKQLIRLTDEQKNIKDDFMKYWHEVLPKKFNLIEKFNHTYAIKNCRRLGGRVLEIGAGIGEHIFYENLLDTKYFALEIRPDMAAVIEQRFPSVKVIVGDCQKKQPFPDNYFDRILAVHVLEHLPDLPSALREAHRILKTEGEFCVMIPCEGGLAYWLARKISAERLFKKRYNMDYNMFIKTEHINKPKEILEELKPYFKIKKGLFWPLFVPNIHLNLVIGLILEPKK